MKSLGKNPTMEELEAMIAEGKRCQIILIWTGSGEVRGEDSRG
jgi:hypothetical protein